MHSRSIGEHAEHLNVVLGIMKENQLVANKKKCSFALKQIEYLGHFVFGKGVSADPSKIMAMEQWPALRNTKEH